MQMKEFCVMQSGCRHETLLQCFGDALPGNKCNNLCDLCLGKKHPLLPPTPNAEGKIDDTVLKKLTGKWPEIKMPAAWKGALSGKKRKQKGGGKGSKKASKGEKAAAG